MLYSLFKPTLISQVSQWLHLYSLYTPIIVSSKIKYLIHLFFLITKHKRLWKEGLKGRHRNGVK